MRRFCKIILPAILLIIFYYPAAYGAESGRIEAEKVFVEAQKALARGDDATAEEHLMKSLQLDPTFTSAIWQLSQIYEKRGKLEYARELILRGLQLDPGASWARDKLAQVEKLLINRLKTESKAFMDSGEYDKALPKLSLYLGIRPHDPEPLFLLGRCHLAIGNLETSKEYLVQAIQRDPTNSESAALLDEVDERIARSAVENAISAAERILADYSADDREKAENALHEVLRIDPGNKWATAKLEEIAVLAEKRETDTEDPRVIEKGMEKIKSIDLSPAGRFPSQAKDRIIIALVIVIIVLLALNLKKQPRKKSYPLQGSLNLIPILDIVSLIHSNLKTGRLVITAGKFSGEIFFEKGEIIQARYRSHDGRTAFHKMMGIGTGKFVYYNHLPKVKHTISEPLSLLLLSMKSADEEASSKKRDRNLVPV